MNDSNTVIQLLFSLFLPIATNKSVGPSGMVVASALVEFDESGVRVLEAEHLEATLGPFPGVAPIANL